MNRARSKLQVSCEYRVGLALLFLYFDADHDSHGRITKLELGPGNAERCSKHAIVTPITHSDHRIPVNCELLMRAKVMKVLISILCYITSINQRSNSNKNTGTNDYEDESPSVHFQFLKKDKYLFLVNASIH